MTDHKHANALTILAQMGGAGRLKAMLGAKNFVRHEDGDGALSFQFPNKARSKPNYCKITLDPSDTYTVAFGRVGSLDYRELATYSDIYADGLKSLFERTTGLYLSL